MNKCVAQFDRSITIVRNSFHTNTSLFIGLFPYKYVSLHKILCIQIGLFSYNCPGRSIDPRGTRGKVYEKRPICMKRIVLKETYLYENNLTKENCLSKEDL